MWDIFEVRLWIPLRLFSKKVVNFQGVLWYEVHPIPNGVFPIPPSFSTHTMYTMLTSQLEHPISLDPRPEYQRAVVNWSPSPDYQFPSASTTGSQCSSRLLSMRSADVLLQLPARIEARAKLEAGAVVRALMLR